MTAQFPTFEEALAEDRARRGGYNSIFDFDNNRKGIAENKIHKTEVDNFKQYIRNPVSGGYWRLTANWVENSDFSRYIYSKVSCPPASGRRKVKGLEVQVSEYSRKLSSTLVTLAACNSNPDRDEFRLKNTRAQRLINATHWLDRIVQTEFCIKFKKACDVYKENIFFDSFVPFVAVDDGLLQTKSGTVVFLSYPSDGDRFCCAGLDYETLRNVALVFEATGQISDVKIDRVFSPEELLFDPYFSFLLGSFSSIFSSNRLAEKLSEAFQKFSAGDFHHCVSSLGIIAEDFLMEIYETFLRQVAPKGLTLGQIYDRINSKISEIVAPEKAADDLMDGIYSQLSNVMSDSYPTAEDKISPLVNSLRSLIDAVKKERADVLKRIDTLSKPQQKSSVFPKYIRESIEELIGYRNAASHKTRVPIGRFDALRALFCLVSMLLWWQSARENIDWHSDVRTIIQKSALAAMKS